MKRYPYWYGFGGLFLLAIIGIIAYWSTHSHVEAMTAKPDSSPTKITDQDIESTITTFLNALAGGNIKEAQNYTSGDTKQILQSNKGQKIDGTLVDDTVTFLFKNDAYAQVKVVATVQTKAGKDRGHYLYTLYKVNQNWKICKIEDLPITYENGKKDNSSDAIKPIIEKYLSAVGKGDWNETAKFLAGNALQELQKSATFLPKQLTTDIKILSQTPVVSSDNTDLMLVEYQVTNDMKEKSHLKTLFQVENIGGDWKITKIMNVLTEGGSH